MSIMALMVLMTALALILVSSSLKLSFLEGDVWACLVQLFVDCCGNLGG